MAPLAAGNVALCGDDELDYLASRTQFEQGQGLLLDEAYRLAHLPLVAPDHPRVIARREGRFYDMGRHERVFSLVLPIADELLRRSPAYLALEAELRASPIAAKIAWDIAGRRRHKLHATLCGSLSTGETPPVLDAMQRDALRRLGPVAVELRGLFSGNVNRGRLYLRAYPEKRRDQHVPPHSESIGSPHDQSLRRGHLQSYRRPRRVGVLDPVRTPRTLVGSVYRDVSGRGTMAVGASDDLVLGPEMVPLI